jgi:hypothetical protein
MHRNIGAIRNGELAFPDASIEPSPRDGAHKRFVKNRNPGRRATRGFGAVAVLTAGYRT